MYTVGDYESILSLALHAICFIVMSIIILHFYVKMRKPSRKISKSIKFAAICVLTFAWIAILFDVIINVFDLTIYYKNNSDIYCYTIYYLRYIRIILFEMVLCIFWIIRLNHTFKHSALEIRLRTFIFIFSLIIIISTALSIIFIILLNDLKNKNIVYNKLLYLPNNSNKYTCIINWNNEILYLLLCSQILILFENITFSTLFWIKLRLLHKIVVNSMDLSSQSARRTQRIYELQQKHTLLATIPIIMTLIIYILFDISNYFSYYTLYFLTNIDMITKCLSMLLFFKFYSRRFGQICYCCIKCFGFSNNELFSYFDPKQTINIYEKTKQLNIEKEKKKILQKTIKNQNEYE
eukprot:188305_1